MSKFNVANLYSMFKKLIPRLSLIANEQLGKSEACNMPGKVLINKNRHRNVGVESRFFTNNMVVGSIPLRMDYLTGRLMRYELLMLTSTETLLTNERT